MNINGTLIGQMITFALFVWFTMKFVWPPLEKILKERQAKIAEGLAAAERGHKELEISQKYAIQHIHEARARAVEMVELAKKQAVVIIENAKTEANEERERIIAHGHAELENERRTVKANLRGEIINLTISSVEKLLKRTLSEKDQEALLEIQTEKRQSK